MSSKGRLTAAEARDLLAIKRNMFDRALYSVRQMCDQGIREATRRGFPSVVFEVPRSMMGKDAYDHHQMITELSQQLFDDGYDIKVDGPVLTVTWDHIPQSQQLPQQRQQPTVYTPPKRTKMTPTSALMAAFSPYNPPTLTGGKVEKNLKFI